MSTKKSLIYRIIFLLFFSISFRHTIILAHANTNSELANTIVDTIINEANTALSVQNSGNNNNLSTESSANDSSVITTDNQADVSQSVQATANTGHNEASRNISIGGNAGIINTGDALINTSAFVDANQSGTSIINSPSQQTQQSAITSTGNDTSTNSNQTANTSVLTIGNNNAVISQSSVAAANTGENLADRNISIGGNAGIITTGTAGIVTNFLVAANKGVVIVGGEANGNGPGSGASIITTEDNTRYAANSTKNSLTQLTSESSANVNQGCGSSQLNDCVAITGGNTSDRNINRSGSAGIINTGDAILTLLLVADVNKTDNDINLPSSSASLSTDLMSTGDNTSVESNSANNTSVDATQSQQAQVDQHVSAVADTGHNTANRNISFGGNAGMITTGNALIFTSLAALTNTDSSLVALFNSPQWGSN